jgi:DNA mismatch repair protein MutS
MAKKTKNAVAETPLMKQYNTIKSKYPDAILLFRVGDFYETFGEDAVKAARILGIVLTKRKNGAAAFIDLAGFPHHSLDVYLPKLVRAGFRVAICDQLEDPKLTKSIVKRGVTELVTPGVAMNDQVLDGKRNNFLAAVHFSAGRLGIAFLDISTGEFLVSEGNSEYISKLLQSFSPREVLYQKQLKKDFQELSSNSFHTFMLEDWVFTESFTNELLLNHFDTVSLKGFGVDKMKLATIAAGACLHYLSETKHDRIAHISKLSRIEEDHYVWMDRFTIRNLELLYSSNENARTLIDVLDRTVSPMGSRLLKRWLALPLKDKSLIEQRLNMVDHFLSLSDDQDQLIDWIKQTGDLERMISKVAVGRINPREVIHILHAIQAIQPLKKYCESSKQSELKKMGDQFHPCEVIKNKIELELVDDPPNALGKGKVIREGVDADLDELRGLSGSAKNVLQKIQEREIEKTGISSLKISYNNVFGYYLEVRNTHKDKVPEEWIRKQTLVNAERYITEELKILEEKILNADEKIAIIENRLFNELILEIADYIGPLQYNASLLAKLDCLLSFSKIAYDNNYTRPKLNDGKELQIKEGRHPVIEKELPLGSVYISNDLFLDTERQQIIMITGPNMSGKSALLRQTALIVIMAQMGSFVPAKYAEIGLVDKIFTRVGASDNISSGESTFMVEMNETASILNNLSDRSLILLDEIGRGTSTYDGISIAWAIAEYIHEKSKAKTLFATHYHELNEMTKSFDRIKNFNVSVKEVGKKVIFLRKLEAGGSAHSFGIHVAKMAGMPSRVIQRANAILSKLEKDHSSDNLTKALPTKDDIQLSFFQLDDPVLEQIRDEIMRIDIDRLTPVEALLKLHEIKNLTGG